MKKTISLIAHIIITICIVLMVTTLIFNPRHHKPSTNVRLKTFNDSLSYALGSYLGEIVADAGYDFNIKMVQRGLVNAQDNTFKLLSDDQIESLMQRYYFEMTAKDDALRLTNQTAGQNFIAQYATDPAVKSTNSGLHYKVLKTSNGKQVKTGDTITAHYTGRFLSGEIFDSSRERERPMTFELYDIVQGLTEGLQLMKVGEIFEFVIPDYLAHGDLGFKNVEPGAYLIYEIEVIGVEDK